MIWFLTSVLYTIYNKVVGTKIRIIEEQFHMEKYLKWYNKIGVWNWNLAGSIVYVSFLIVMLYLTNTVGLNPVVGTLIMVSKLFDGVNVFGTLIDKTKSELGLSNRGCFMHILAVR